MYRLRHYPPLALLLCIGASAPSCFPYVIPPKVELDTDADTDTVELDTDTTGLVTDTLDTSDHTEGIAEHEDVFLQGTPSQVDVLFVMDNSCSMLEEQNLLADHFPEFLSYFVGSGLDWHIGVVSTDMDDASHQGKLRSIGGNLFLEESVPNAVAVFAEMVQLGTSGSANEKGRAATYAALEVEKNGYNDGFYRDDASLAIILISDENDYSGNNPISLNEFIDWLIALKPDDIPTTFSSIVNPEHPPCPDGLGVIAEIGADYLTVTSAIGGMVWPICNQAWNTMLNDLGILATNLQYEFFLTPAPVVDTIEVWVVDSGTTDTFEVDSDYTYDTKSNSIYFLTYLAPALSEVHISYQIDDET